jgi:hypothetical protein
MAALGFAPPARCSVLGCTNFGQAANGGRCNGCFAGRPPALDPGRVTETAAVLASSEPDTPEVVAGKLARSLEVARQFDADCPPGRAHVPFSMQRKVRCDKGEV